MKKVIIRVFVSFFSILLSVTMLSCEDSISSLKKVFGISDNESMPKSKYKSKSKSKSKSKPEEELHTTELMCDLECAEPNDSYMEDECYIYNQYDEYDAYDKYYGYDEDEEIKSQDELIIEEETLSCDDEGEDIEDSWDDSYSTPEEELVEDNQLYTLVEQKPAFPGGDKALLQYISENIKYPSIAQENGIQGRVVLRFVVEKDGSVGPVNVIRGVHPDLDKEAIRVVKSLPRFVPGKENGRPVRVWYSLPVQFKLM